MHLCMYVCMYVCMYEKIRLDLRIKSDSQFFGPRGKIANYFTLIRNLLALSLRIYI